MFELTLTFLYLSHSLLQENPVQSVFRQYIQNTIKSFFGGEPKELPSKGAAFGEVDIALEQKFGATYPPAVPVSPVPPVTEPAVVPPKKHHSRMTGLSKYGPWGYLFLGMLICGGALLICGLWGKLLLRFCGVRFSLCLQFYVNAFNPSAQNAAADLTSPSTARTIRFPIRCPRFCKPRPRRAAVRPGAME